MIPSLKIDLLMPSLFFSGRETKGVSQSHYHQKDTMYSESNIPYELWEVHSRLHL